MTIVTQFSFRALESII